MIGAPVWHVWIGLALTGLALAVTLGVIAYYFISVQAQKYPGGKQGRQQDL